MVAANRDRNHLKILPAAVIMVSGTFDDAKVKQMELNSYMHYNSVKCLNLRELRIIRFNYFRK